MGKRICPQLQQTDCRRAITEERDGAFLAHLCAAVLLALKEQGVMNTVQYRYAEEKRKKQWKKTDAEEKKA